MKSSKPETGEKVDVHGRVSLSERAYQAIRDMLTTAEIAPGDPLNEDQLAKKFQMGRTPVREAIKRLETERLIVVYPRRGIFATPVHLSDLTLLSEVREHLEGEAAFQAARRASRYEREGFKELLDEAMERQSEISAETNFVSAEIDFDSRVHRAIYRAAHNPYLESTVEQYYNLTIRLWHVWKDRLPEMSSHISELAPLLKHIIEGNPAGAREIAISHVSSFQKAITSQAP